MLFGYPLAAVQDNWFHDTVVLTLTEIHKRVDAGEPLPAWPDILPLPAREKLKNRHGLKDRFFQYSKAYTKLGKKNRARISQCLVEQNRIEELLNNTAECETLQNLPKSVQVHIANLFDFAFSLLSPLKIRDEQYRLILVGNTSQICPFCGIEYFDSLGAPREDLDHYLLQSSYPFAGVNLQNLAPMGEKCNKKYKKAQDILRGPFGRRVAFYPFGAGLTRVSLVASQPFHGEDGRLPAWEVTFLPNSPQCDTWDEVFQIRTRYRRDVLDVHYDEWLRSFSAWCASTNFDAAQEKAVLVQEGLTRYLNLLSTMRLSGREFLRVIVFEMFIHHCVEGNQRLLDFLHDLMIPKNLSSPLAA